MRNSAFCLIALVAAPALSGGEPDVLTLEDAKRLARQNNLDVRIARERLSQAANLSGRAWAGVLPIVSARGSYARNKAVELQLFDYSSIPADQRELVEAIFGSPSGETQYVVPPNQWNAGVSVTWPLVSAPAIARITSAYDAVEIAEVTYEQTETTLLFGTSLAYFGLVNANQQVKIRERALEVARAHLRLSEAKVAVGEETRVTALRSDVEVAAAEQDLIQARNSARLAERALATLIGYVNVDGTAKPIRVARPKLVALDEDGDLLARAYAARLDLRGLDLQLQIAERDRLTTWLTFLPAVVGNGSYSWTDPSGAFGDADSWSAGVALEWSLFAGGLRWWQLDEQHHAINAATLAIEKTREGIATDLHEARLNLESTRANLAAAKRRVELARETAELVQAQFEVGAATQLDVLDANRGLADAETAGALAELAVDLAQLALERILVIPAMP